MARITYATFRQLLDQEWSIVELLGRYNGMEIAEITDGLHVRRVCYEIE